jgi:predicted phage baseplate assembly protein
VAASADVDGRKQRRYFDPEAPAAASLAPGLENVIPVVRLQDDSGRGWLPQRDLLASDAFAPEFVLEVEDDGTAAIRFGDDEYGMRPPEKAKFDASYRIGNGTRGNVGAGSIRHVALAGADAALANRIVGVRNPQPATGGTDPESIDHVRQSAPAAFKVLQRAVTPEDYVTIAERHPDVQRAQATVRWTGSWPTVFLSIDRLGGRAVDADFRRELMAWLERFRMAGHDVEINGPRFVFIELELTACVARGYFRSDVRSALLEALGAGVLPDGRKGFFHPDSFTFGSPVYLSGIHAVAQTVEGVRWAEVTKLQRLGDASRSVAGGELSIGRLEVARLDNDPNFPERGVLRLTLEGGR